MKFKKNKWYNKNCNKGLKFWKGKINQFTKSSIEASAKLIKVNNLTIHLCHANNLIILFIIYRLLKIILILKKKIYKENPLEIYENKEVELMKLQDELE